MRAVRLVLTYGSSPYSKGHTRTVVVATRRDQDQSLAGTDGEEHLKGASFSVHDKFAKRIEFTKHGHHQSDFDKRKAKLSSLKLIESPSACGWPYANRKRTIMFYW